MRAEATIDLREVTRDICWHDDNTLLYVSHSGVLQVIDIRSHQMVCIHCLFTNDKDILKRDRWKKRPLRGRRRDR